MPADENATETNAAGAPETMANAPDVGPPFRFGAVLGRAFSILFRNIVPFGLLGLVVYSPHIALSVLIQQSAADPASDPARIGLLAIGTTFLYVLLYFFLNATVVYGTVQDLRGGKVMIGACMGRGLSTIFPVLGVGILVWLLIALGMVLLIIPGLIAMVMLWVAIPVTVTERRGPIESLRRSRQLTKGNRWQIFAIIVLIILMNIAAGAVIQLGLFAGGTAAFIVVTAINWVAAIFFALLLAVASAVGYHDLRAAKEGADTEQIAAVFD